MRVPSVAGVGLPAAAGDDGPAVERDRSGEMDHHNDSSLTRQRLLALVRKRTMVGLTEQEQGEFRRLVVEQRGRALLARRLRLDGLGRKPVAGGLPRHEGLHLSLQRHGWDLAELRMRGGLDAYTQGEFRKGMRSLIGTRAEHLVVDLTELDSIDSIGAGAIAHFAQRPDLAERIALVVANPRIHRLLRIWGLDSSTHVQVA